nr:MAG TPA: hypothetical protein [Caudoviricetes sp.]
MLVLLGGFVQNLSRFTVCRRMLEYEKRLGIK